MPASSISLAIFGVTSSPASIITFLVFGLITLSTTVLPTILCFKLATGVLSLTIAETFIPLTFSLFVAKQSSSVTTTSCATSTSLLVK